MLPQVEDKKMILLLSSFALLQVILFQLNIVAGGWVMPVSTSPKPPLNPFLDKALECSNGQQ